MVRGTVRVRAATIGRPDRRKRGHGDLLLDAAAASGQAAASSRIENYLGFTSGISGAELTGRAAVQARKFGARIASPSQAARLDTTHERLTALKHEGGTLDTYLANYGLFYLKPTLRWIDMTAARLDALAREVRK